MAKPERLPGGFELANGRAADRVSEKEAEAGRSRRGSWSASAAASPWHDPGLRLQRLHKEAFLGAAVSLLVRGRRQAGPREGWPPPRSPGPAASPGSPPPAPTGALVPLPSESGLPAPPTGAGLLLLPLTGGPAASLLTWPLAELCSLLCCPAAVLRPSLYGQKLVPFCPLVGDRPFSPPTETGPAPSCPAVGVAPSASPPAPEGLGRAVICQLLVGSSVPRDRLWAARPGWVGSPVRRASWGSGGLTPGLCTIERLTCSNSDLSPAGHCCGREDFPSADGLPTRCLASQSPSSLSSSLL